MSNEEIKTPTGTTIYVASRNVYRGPRLVMPYDYNYMINTLGIKSFLNLEHDPEHMEDKEYRAIYDVEKELRCYSVPLGELWAPSREDLRTAVRIIRDCRVPIYVHCRRGVDRTGYVIAAYRMLVEGWCFKAAYNECLSFGHSPVIYFHWKSRLKGLSW